MAGKTRIEIGREVGGGIGMGEIEVIEIGIRKTAGDRQKRTGIETGVTLRCSGHYKLSMIIQTRQSILRYCLKTIKSNIILLLCIKVGLRFHK